MEKKNIDWGSIGFGYIPTDYRYVANFKDGKWDEGQLTTDPNVTLNECACVFQYAQTVFEGMKAYKNNGKVYLFRPLENLKRLNKSNDRLCIPQIDEEKVLEYLYKFVDLERDWIPEDEGCSLYIRPFIIATDAQLGVKVSNEYKLIIIASPSGSYYKNGLSPVSIYVEKDYQMAYEYYLLACQKQNREGFYHLGRWFFYGIGQKEDKHKAMQYYQQASHYHYSKASFMLGYMYHYGDGISKDLEKAKEYYQLALQEGYLEAQKELDKLEVEK